MIYHKQLRILLFFVLMMPFQLVYACNGGALPTFAGRFNHFDQLCSELAPGFSEQGTGMEELGDFDQGQIFSPIGNAIHSAVSEAKNLAFDIRRNVINAITSPKKIIPFALGLKFGSQLSGAITSGAQRVGGVTLRLTGSPFLASASAQATTFVGNAALPIAAGEVGRITDLSLKIAKNEPHPNNIVKKLGLQKETVEEVKAHQEPCMPYMADEKNNISWKECDDYLKRQMRAKAKGFKTHVLMEKRAKEDAKIIEARAKNFDAGLMRKVWSDIKIVDTHTHRDDTIKACIDKRDSYWAEEFAKSKKDHAFPENKDKDSEKSELSDRWLHAKEMIEQSAFKRAYDSAKTVVSAVYNNPRDTVKKVAALGAATVANNAACVLGHSAVNYAALSITGHPIIFVTPHETSQRYVRILDNDGNPVQQLWAKDAFAVSDIVKRYARCTVIETSEWRRCLDLPKVAFDTLREDGYIKDRILELIAGREPENTSLASYLVACGFNVLMNSDTNTDTVQTIVSNCENGIVTEKNTTKWDAEQYYEHFWPLIRGMRTQRYR